MILSNVRIQEALDKGWLKITPEPSPRKKTQHADECPYQTSSVDLRLGNEVSWLKPGIPANVDLRKGGFAKLFGPNSETREITEEQPFALQPSRFILARTLERVELPIHPAGLCLAARIEGRSSYARSGLVHFTAPTIHAGFKGTITLEMINFGPLPILLYPGMFVAQLIIEVVDGVPFDNESQFQGQSRPGGVNLPGTP
jgi:dCTP deaminase